MVLEMRRALEALKENDLQGYRKLFDASYEEVYCRSILIIRQEDQAMEFVKDFFIELFRMLKETKEAESQEKWFWHQYYQKMRKQYHKLLSNQSSQSAEGNTLADVLANFPLLHRIMLIMRCQDNFTAREISAIFGLDEEKIGSELSKMEKALPSLTKEPIENSEGYLDNWKLLLLGASKQVADVCSFEWVDRMYAEAAFAAGITGTSTVKKKDTFEYFVADVDVEPEKPKKKVVPIVEEEPEDDDYEEDEEPDEDEEDYEDDEDEDDDDDRYDWDLEDDGKRMVIIGIVLALVIVIIVGFAAFKLLNKDDDSEKKPSRTEQEEDEAPLLIKGDDDDSDEADAPEEAPEENPEEVPEEEPEEEPSSEGVVMEVIPNSMNVRSEPNTDSTIVTKVKAGDKVEVVDDPSQEWVSVRCVDQDGKEGYVKSEYLKASE